MVLLAKGLSSRGKKVIVVRKMSESEEEYERLKSEIIRETQGSLDLEKVKSFFKLDINSTRALSRVQSLKDIFHILQERDVLHSKKVTALKYLGELLENEAVINLVKVYEKLHVNLEPCLCGDENLYVPSIPSTPENTDQEQRTAGQSLQLVIQNIANNIGPNWQVLASELDIPWCYVDEVRKKYPSDYSKQALKVLEIWMKYNNGNATLEALKTALNARLCLRKGLGLHLLNPAIRVE